MKVVEEIKKKREFSRLPDSIIERAAKMAKGDVKESRALLRKYFGVFLTNRVLRFGRSQIAGRRSQEILGVHMSSKKRDYRKFYSKIFEAVGGCGRLGEDFDDCRHRIGSVVDLGCGVNGFSYEYLPKGISYVGVEAAGQLVDLMNGYFEGEGFSAEAVCLDLFDVKGVLGILKKVEKPRVVFLFQVIDALESLERDFSKKFLLEISGECEWIVLSLPVESLGGRKKFESRRKWLMDFLVENFVVVREFVGTGEKIIILKNKK